MTKRRLGRGLAALLGTDEGGYDGGSLELAELAHLPVDQIDPNPWQPRRTFDAGEIAALADSLRQHGMLQPVLVRPVGERYQLIAGERRLRAALEAHLHEVPARVMDLDDQRVSELAMVENLQREDLNAIDKAQAFRQYLESYGGTQEDLAGRLGIDRSTIANLIRLLELPDEIQKAVCDKLISAGHARAILSIATADARIAAFRRILELGLSVRQTEELIQQLAHGDGEGVGETKGRVDPPQSESTPRGGKAPYVLEVEQALGERFGTVVAIRVKGRERGQILIEFQSREEFDRITGAMRG